MSIKINNDNYDTYKKVFSVIMTRVWEDFKKLLPEDSNPLISMERLELEGKSIANKALQSGLNDVLYNLKEYPKQTLEEIDAHLKKEDLPELRTLLTVIPKTIEKVLKEKKIRNINQYYIIKEVLDDTASEITRDQRHLLSKFLGDFEVKASKTTNR